MPAFDATVGGENATSYSDVAFADDYFSSRTDSVDWGSLQDSDKELQLMTATARLEQERWTGARSTSAQALDWPRQGVINEKKDVGFFVTRHWGITREYFPSDEIPDIVKQACCELALALGRAPKMLRDSGYGDFKSLRIEGRLTAEFRDQISEGDLPSQVQRMLSGLLLTGEGFRRLARA